VNTYILFHSADGGAQFWLMDGNKIKSRASLVAENGSSLTIGTHHGASPGLATSTETERSTFSSIPPMARCRSGSWTAIGSGVEQLSSRRTAAP